MINYILVLDGPNGLEALSNHPTKEEAIEAGKSYIGQPGYSKMFIMKDEFETWNPVNAKEVIQDILKADYKPANPEQADSRFVRKKEDD